MRNNASWLFVSDVDDTLVGDEAALARLSAHVEAAADKIILVYNSSRPCTSLRQTLMEEANLLTPDYLIGALGTEIETLETAGLAQQTLVEYEQYLQENWEREKVVALVEDLMAKGLDFIPHPAQFQTRFKASFDIPGDQAYRQFRQRLDESGLAAKVIYSAGKYLDLIPVRAGKGEAIHFLAGQLAVSPENVVVAGDSGNDLDMFVAPYRGIIVANADDDLKEKRGDHIFHASLPYAAGLLEGLRFWKVI
jgi:sucrose-6F-phosphate phosphohydrolase